MPRSHEGGSRDHGQRTSSCATCSPRRNPTLRRRRSSASWTRTPASKPASSPTSSIPPTASRATASPPEGCRTGGSGLLAAQRWRSTAWTSWPFDDDGPGDHGLRDVAQAGVVVAGVAAEHPQGVLHVNLSPLGQHTPGLLHDHPAVERPPPLPASAASQSSVQRRTRVCRKSTTSKSATNVSANSTRVPASPCCCAMCVLSVRNGGSKDNAEADLSAIRTLRNPTATSGEINEECGPAPCPPRRRC